MGRKVHRAGGERAKCAPKGLSTALVDHPEVLRHVLFLAAVAMVLAVPAVQPPPPLSADLSSPAWTTAAHVRLERDLTFRSNDRGQTTDAYIESDDRYIYVAFVCNQTVPIVAEQNTHQSYVYNDDNVTVQFWPAGRTGTTYSFVSTSNGTHGQSSSENTAFAPNWDSLGKTTDHGYNVVMRIPRDVMRGDGRSDWLVQFSRSVVKMSLNLVWSWDPAMSWSGDPLYAGTAQKIGVSSTAVARPKPRIQPYGLVQSNANRRGEGASRTGLDFSIPIATASFYGTFHPDYSEVERDQQTIAPQEFAYRYQEVRPFFTQGTSYYDNTTLYTPAIPTPRYGYAIEGKRGGMTFAGFNALGQQGRDDNAELLTWQSDDQKYTLGGQRVNVQNPGFSDPAVMYGASIGNGKHFSMTGAYYGEAGTNITIPAEGRQTSFGMNFWAPNENFNFSRTDTGSQFSPADSYTAYNDAHGYNANLYRAFAFEKGKLEQITFNAWGDRYANGAGQVKQVDSSAYLSLRNRHQSGMGFNYSISRGLTPGRGMIPYDSSGLYVYDNANSAHGFSMSYSVGHFYDGVLRQYFVGGHIKLNRRHSLAANESRYLYSSSAIGVALERQDSLTYSFQYSKDGSLAAGMRWISGTPAYFTLQPTVRTSNLSFSLNQRIAHMHAYMVYGDPNAPTTLPSLVFKLVDFIGAGEGT